MDYYHSFKNNQTQTSAVKLLWTRLTQTVLTQFSLGYKLFLKIFIPT